MLRAIRSVGVDAILNDRNDICVENFKICPPCHIIRLVSVAKSRNYVSGSAYKIVKDRAYHHGTMLISTRLDTLGELLRSGKVRLHVSLDASLQLH